jgi:hypothetical protein
MGGAMPGHSTGSEAAVRHVIVMGDVTMDWHLARMGKPVDSAAAWNAVGRTEVYRQPGGAALMANLMNEVMTTLAADRVTVEVWGPSALADPIEPADPRLHYSFATWSQYPRRQGDRDRSVWRVEEFLGLADLDMARRAVIEYVAS